MRVITGTARGRKLVSPTGNDVRPTSDMVKEAMFSILQNDIPGAKVLDLFAGSGQLGIEAISRGAEFCTFVDSSGDSVEIIKKNVALTKFEDKSRVSRMEAKSFLVSSRESYDIAIMDAPYNQGLITEILPLIAEKIAPLGIIVCESALKEEFPDSVLEFTRKKEYRYGKIKLTTYRREEE